jgi:hypothetical protein
MQNNIALDLVNVDPTEWKGGLSRIWAHDETPQFITLIEVDSLKTATDCKKVPKENREFVTVQPFSNFASDMAICQVIFSGSEFTSHMCPSKAAEKIFSLVLNESGCTTGETLLVAYKELSKQRSQKKGGICWKQI